MQHLFCLIVLGKNDVEKFLLNSYLGKMMLKKFLLNSYFFCMLHLWYFAERYKVFVDLYLK